MFEKSHSPISNFSLQTYIGRNASLEQRSSPNLKSHNLQYSSQVISPRITLSASCSSDGKYKRMSLPKDDNVPEVPEWRGTYLALFFVHRNDCHDAGDHIKLDARILRNLGLEFTSSSRRLCPPRSPLGSTDTKVSLRFRQRHTSWNAHPR